MKAGHALPPLNALRAFEAAARHLSMSRAAEELAVTHGAVSRQVRALEAALGVRLFERLNRRIELTEAGHDLLAEAAPAFERLAAAVHRVRGAHGRRPLVVSCVATFAMRWLIPRLADFQARHPEIEVVLTAPDSPVERPRGDADLAVRVGPLAEPAAGAAEPFLEERAGPVLAPALAGVHRLERPSDLARVPLLHTRSRRGAWADWAKDIGAAGLDAQRGRLFETFYFLLEAAEAGLGAAIGPLPLVREELRAGRLVAPFGFRPSGRRMLLLVPPRTAADPRAAAFRGWLAAAGAAWSAETAEAGL